MFAHYPTIGIAFVGAALTLLSLETGVAAFVGFFLLVLTIPFQVGHQQHEMLTSV